MRGAVTAVNSVPINSQGQTSTLILQPACGNRHYWPIVQYQITEQKWNFGVMQNFFSHMIFILLFLKTFSGVQCFTMFGSFFCTTMWVRYMYSYNPFLLKISFPFKSPLGSGDSSCGFVNSGFENLNQIDFSAWDSFPLPCSSLHPWGLVQGSH